MLIRRRNPGDTEKSRASHREFRPLLTLKRNRSCFTLSHGKYVARAELNLSVAPVTGHFNGRALEVYLK